MIFILIMPPPPDERPDDLVDAHYVATRFGCSARSVQARLCGTAKIPRVIERPLRFRRGDVDEELHKLLDGRATPAQRAIRLLGRKQSLLRKTVA